MELQNQETSSLKKTILHTKRQNRTGWWWFWWGAWPDAGDLLRLERKPSKCCTGRSLDDPYPRRPSTHSSPSSSPRFYTVISLNLLIIMMVMKMVMIMMIPNIPTLIWPFSPGHQSQCSKVSFIHIIFCSLNFSLSGMIPGLISILFHRRLAKIFVEKLQKIQALFQVYLDSFTIHHLNL